MDISMVGRESCKMFLKEWETGTASFMGFLLCCMCCLLPQTSVLFNLLNLCKDQGTWGSSIGWVSDS